MHRGYIPCLALKFPHRTLQVVGVVTRDELTELTMKGQELIEVMGQEQSNLAE
jgi:hypothetical protein